MCTGAYRGRGVSLFICTYALTDSYSYHVFFLRGLVLTIMKKGLFLYIFESPQKQAFDFLKIIPCTNVRLKFLSDAKLIMPLLIL